MANGWIVQRDGKQIGPMPAAKLRELASTGKLKPTDQVQMEGMNKFVAAQSVKGLFPEAQPVSPAKPPPLPEVQPVSPATPPPLPVLSTIPLAGVRTWVMALSGLGVVLAGGVIAAAIVFSNNPADPAPSRPGDEYVQNSSKKEEPVADAQVTGVQQVASTDKESIPRQEVTARPKAENAAQARSPGQTRFDDELLWKAAVTCGYTHNGASVSPEMPDQHAEVLDRYVNGGSWRAPLAKTIITREVVDSLHFNLVKTDKSLQAKIPSAVRISAADSTLKLILGREPKLGEIMKEDLGGGFVDTIDRIRITKVAINKTEIYHGLLTTSIADQAETQYKSILRGKSLPAEARIFFSGNRSTVGITYAGKQPLTNVVVVTRAIMKPPPLNGAVTSGLINQINEAFEPDSDRTKMAAKYMETSQLLHATDQANLIYVPVLEPGDTLSMPVWEGLYFWDIKESKVSLFSTAGAVLEKVLFVGGPENDLSLSAQQRMAGSKPPVEEKPVGPRFDYVNGRVEITLKSGATGPFERCVAVGASVLTMDIKDDVDASKPLEVIAKGANAYVVRGPKKLMGRGLVLVPKEQVAEVKDLTPKAPVIERGTVQYVKTNPTWLLLKPLSEGAKAYEFATCSTLLNGICTKTGRTVEFTFKPEESLRAVATWDENYVVFLQKPAKDGATIALIPKSVVREVKTKK